jgi:hypothetical protein
MIDTDGLDGESNNAVSRDGGVRLMVVKDNVDMVVDKSVRGLFIVEADWEASCIVFLLRSVDRESDSSRG